MSTTCEVCKCTCKRSQVLGHYVDNASWNEGIFYGITVEDFRETGTGPEVLIRYLKNDTKLWVSLDVLNWHYSKIQLVGESA
jgi:hypothetical protein